MGLSGDGKRNILWGWPYSNLVNSRFQAQDVHLCPEMQAVMKMAGLTNFCQTGDFN